MPYQATVFRVMIASPSDVENERRLIPEVLQEWNSVNSFEKRIVLIPMRWETDSAPIMGNRPQEIINKQVLKDCDLLVGIFWTRIGTPTGESVSGTVEEIEKHIDAGKPVMLYFSSAKVPPDSIEPKQYEELKAFKEKCKAEGRIETYKSLDEFRKKFAHQLPLLINKDEYFKVETLASTIIESKVLVDSSDLGIEEMAPTPDLSPEAKELLIEASQDRIGTIMLVRDRADKIVQTNGKQFGERGNSRSQADWEAAINELHSLELLQEEGYSGESFTVTSFGYKVADILREINTHQQPGELSDEQVKILMLLAKYENSNLREPTDDEIASELNLSNIVVRYHLKLLEEKEFLWGTESIDEPSYYSLDQNGREYLIKYKLL